MNIQYNNIGTEFEKFDLYLEEKDYHNLFEEEIAFGKLLRIFEDLGKIISEDPKELREWVSDDSRYKGVLEVSEEICKILLKEEEERRKNNQALIIAMKKVKELLGKEWSPCLECKILDCTGCALEPRTSEE